MSHKLPRTRILGLVMTLVGLLAASRAQAQLDSVGNCLFHAKGNSGKNVILMPGSTSLIPVVQFLGAKLIKMPNPYVLVYFPKPSCEAMTMVSTQGWLSGSGEIYEEDPGNPGKIITKSCTLDGRVNLHMAIGDTYYETCGDSTKIATLGDFEGPQQAFVFITPRSNFYSSTMTAEQARTIYGCGSKGAVAPFVDDSFIYAYADKPGLQFGAQLLVRKFIGSPIFRGVASGAASKIFDGDNNLAMAVGASISPEKTIGFVSAEIYDQQRDKLKSLAFRGFRQTLAYYPDSSAGSRDKRNVRDGHYAIQAPMHLWAKVKTDGTVEQALARKMIDWMQGNPVSATDQLPFDINEVYAQAGVVPKCAMKVKRTTDGGPLMPFVPEKAPCGCSYESKATGVATPPGCVACKGDGDCGTGEVCSHGFCESCQ